MDADFSGRVSSPGLGKLSLLAVGFGCMVGYTRMLSLGFVGYLSQGVIESVDAWYVLRAASCLVTLTFLALAGWRRWFSVSVPAFLIATAGAVSAAVVFAVDGSGQLGWIVATVGGVSAAVLMFVWMLLLSRVDVHALVGVGLAGLAVSGAIVMGVPHLDFALSLMVAVISGFVAGAAALLVDGKLQSCAADGPLQSAQVARLPWITVVMVLVCGFLATVLYGIAERLTWLYDWTPNYPVFGASVVIVMGWTLVSMVRSKRWMHFVWIPQFVLLVLALLFACFSVRESIQIAVGLMLAAVFCAHFLHWIIYPALFGTLQVPRAFLAGVVLFFSNGALSTALGDMLGGALPHSMQNLGGVAGVVVIMLVATFAVTFAVYRHAFGTVGLLAVLMPSSVSGVGMIPSSAGQPGVGGETRAQAGGNPAGSEAFDASSSAHDVGETVLREASSEVSAANAQATSTAPAAAAMAADDVSGGEPGSLSASMSAAAEAASESSAPNPLDILRAHVDSFVEPYGLTPREQEVAFLTVQGFSCGYIADKLVVSESTVRFHQKNLYRKLDVHSKNELIEFMSNAAR